MQSIIPTDLIEIKISLLKKALKSLKNEDDDYICLALETARGKLQNNSDSVTRDFHIEDMERSLKAFIRIKIKQNGTMESFIKAELKKVDLEIKKTKQGSSVIKKFCRRQRIDWVKRMIKALKNGKNLPKPRIIIK